MLLDLCVYEEMVNDALPVSKQFGLEQDLEMAGFEVKAAIFALEKVLNQIEECKKIQAETGNKAA